MMRLDGRRSSRRYTTALAVGNGVTGIAWVLVLVLVGAADALPGDAAEVISIIMEGTYFTEPATVRFLVAVEPNEENRFLWVEAESDDLYRASEVSLSGAREKRLHGFVFTSLPGGHYMLRVQVRSMSGVRGLATRSIVVVGERR
jgi:hypothetical protein